MSTVKAVTHLTGCVLALTSRDTAPRYIAGLAF